MKSYQVKMSVAKKIEDGSTKYTWEPFEQKVEADNRHNAAVTAIKQAYTDGWFRTENITVTAM